MIPFVDLKAQYSAIKPEIDIAIGKVFESGQFVLGDEVVAFENEFASFCGASHGIAVNSGTSALHLSMLAANIGPGDEVITVPFTFVATVAAIRYTGARPVLVDIEPRSFNMDVKKIETAITSRTKAILPVHLYGQPADMDSIMDVARHHGLVVIEDAAQAHAAKYNERPVGSIGDIGCFSFYPGKNLGAYGEGGMVVTNDSHYANIIGMLRDWGQEQRYRHLLQGYNYRMDALQGAILRVKLRHLDVWTAARREHAAIYDELLSDENVKTPDQMSFAHHVYHIYAIRSSNRDWLQQSLSDQGVQTGIHYPIPVHLQEAHRDLGYRCGDFPHAEKAATEVISLPMFAEITVEQQREVASAIRLTRM